MKPTETPSSDPAISKEGQELYKEINFEDTRSLLTCPKCNHFISGIDLNIEKTIAKCSHCHHVFGFEHDSHSGQLRPSQIMPEGVEVLKLRSELDIRLKWMNTTSKDGRTFLMLFAGFWNLMVLPFALFAVLTGAWGILLFLSLHLLVGLGLLWHLATVYVNRTSISVTKNRLRVRTFPLKHFLWKSTDIETDAIRQLYVSKYVQSTSNGEPNFAYALYGIIEGGEKVCLVRGMNRATQIFVEKEIEDYLGIKNRKVAEEVNS